ncbi:hypothetical protein KM043_017946 [Ampulex compressa]|nr:hypothetical protein KM043_017946 [Ampulex compressa]
MGNPLSDAERTPGSEGKGQNEPSAYRLATCLSPSSIATRLPVCRVPVAVPMERVLFGSRSVEGVHPAYVVNTLTILLADEGGPGAPCLHLTDQTKRVTSAYATMTSGHVVKKLHF